MKTKVITELVEIVKNYLDEECDLAHVESYDINLDLCLSYDVSVSDKETDLSKSSEILEIEVIFCYKREELRNSYRAIYTLLQPVEVSCNEHDALSSHQAVHVKARRIFQ